jgi:hypothetical protein
VIKQINDTVTVNARPRLLCVRNSSQSGVDVCGRCKAVLLRQGKYLTLGFLVYKADFAAGCDCAELVGIAAGTGGEFHQIDRGVWVSIMDDAAGLA